jgi:hypothetical protein
MFERFSSGYYLGRLYVEPRDETERAVIARERHEQVNEQLYADGDDDGVRRTDLPLVMKLETTHFAVHGDEGVPEGTLAVPPEFVEETGLRNPPSLKEVFLAKGERARQLLSVAEGTPTSEAAIERVTDDPLDGFDVGGGPAV